MELWERFGDYCKEKRLVLQRCKDCGRFRWPLSVLCPYCHSMDYSWEEVSGKGKVYSYVVYNVAFFPGWEDKSPYTVAIVELEEGVRLPAQVRGDVACNIPVILDWFLYQGTPVPVFVVNK